MTKTVVGLVQQSCMRDRNENLAKSVSGIREAASREAQIVLLQELHLGPYFCQTEDPAAFDLAEPVPGPATKELGGLAGELHVVIVASIFEHRAAGLYHNTAVVIDRDGTIAGIYRKMHIPDDPGYYEKYYFTPGDLGFHPVSTSIGKIGVLVCWDQWYPEAARLMALRGAEILVYPTAIGWETGTSETEQETQLDAWITIQRSHAIANALPVLCANRVGFEPEGKEPGRGQIFWGNSFIAGPRGQFLARAGRDLDEVLTATVDPAETEEIRRNWPFFRDRRIDAYDGLLDRYGD